MTRCIFRNAHSLQVRAPKICVRLLVRYVKDCHLHNSQLFFTLFKVLKRTPFYRRFRMTSLSCQKIPKKRKMKWIGIHSQMSSSDSRMACFHQPGAVGTSNQVPRQLVSLSVSLTGISIQLAIWGITTRVCSVGCQSMTTMDLKKNGIWSQCLYRKMIQ